jgi:hypothetical protein
MGGYFKGGGTARYVILRHGLVFTPGMGKNAGGGTARYARIRHGLASAANLHAVTKVCQILF